MSPDREEKLDQLKNITAISDEDLLKSVLEENDWDLESSIHALLQHDTAPLITSSHNQPTRHPKRVCYHLEISHKAAIINPSQKRDNEPKKVVARFIQDFESKYGTTHPEFYRGSYSQALDQAKRDLTYVIAVVISPYHDDNDRFCRQVLCNQETIDFLRNNYFTVWAGSVLETEPFQVSNTLLATTFPFIALIGLQNNRMVVIDRFQGMSEMNDLRDQLSRHATRLNAQYALVRAEREERLAAQRIREQQDAAYRASLQADEEKRKKAREEALIEERRKEQEKLKEKETKDKIQRKIEKRNQLKKSFPPEPSDDTPNIAKISIRLPNGQRIVRKFLASDKVQVRFRLYEFDFQQLADFLETQDLEPIPIESEIEILNSYPRRVITDYSATIQEAGLYPSATLIIEEKDEH